MSKTLEAEAESPHLTEGEEENDDHECSYLVSENDFSNHNVEVIAGDKSGSQWLVINKTWIFHKNTASVDGSEVFWECTVRRKFTCPARAATRNLENGDLEIIYLYHSDCHQCDQDGIDVIKQNFKNTMKSILLDDHRKNYSHVKYKQVLRTKCWAHLKKIVLLTADNSC